MVRLELFAEAGGFDRRKAVMRVVEQVEVGAEFLAQTFEQAGDKIEVELGAPRIFSWRIFFGGLVKHFAAADTIGALKAGDAALRANGSVAELGIVGDSRDGGIDVFTIGVAVDQDGVARRAPEQLIDGHVEGFALDVPERGVDRGDGGHGDGAAAPVRAFIEVLPSVFDAARVAADEKRDDVIGEIAGDSEFAAVERGVTQAVDAVFGGDFERDKVSAWAADDYFGVGYAHRGLNPLPKFQLRASSNIIARTLAAHKIGVLQRLGLALDGDGGDRMIGRFAGQSGEAHAEAILLEFDLLATDKKARGFYAGF